MASIAIQCPLRIAPTRLWLFERALPYLAFVPFSYFIYAHLVASIKKKVVLDAKTGKIKQTFIMNWMKMIGVDRVVLKDLPIRYKALGVLDRASFYPLFHAACLSMVTKVVNMPAFTEAGKSSMFDISAAVVLTDQEVQANMKGAFAESSIENYLSKTNEKAQKKQERKIRGFF